MTSHLTLLLAYFLVIFSKNRNKMEEYYNDCLWFRDFCNVFYIWVCNSSFPET